MIIVCTLAYDPEKKESYFTTNLPTALEGAQVAVQVLQQVLVNEMVKSKLVSKEGKPLVDSGGKIVEGGKDGTEPRTQEVG